MAVTQSRDADGRTMEAGVKACEAMSTSRGHESEKRAGIGTAGLRRADDMGSRSRISRTERSGILPAPERTVS